MLPNVKPSMFWICIFARSFLVFLAYKQPSPMLMYVILAMAIGFLSLAFGLTKRDVGPEAGGRIWWAENRIVHGLLLISAAINMNNEIKNPALPRTSWKFLLLSLIFGSTKRYKKRNNLFNS